jgi:hypothetical protein
MMGETPPANYSKSFQFSASRDDGVVLSALASGSRVIIDSCLRPHSSWEIMDRRSTVQRIYLFNAIHQLMAPPATEKKWAIGFGQEEEK